MKVGFVKTPTTERIWSLLDACADDGSLGLVLGGAGVGKTTALERYKESRGSRVVLVRAKEALRTPRGLLETLSAAFDLSGSVDDSLSSLYRRVEYHLTHYLTSPGLVIIDECQTLEVPALTIIRDLHDMTRETIVGIVLIGNDDLQIKIRKEESRVYSMYDPLLSRIGSRRTYLDKPSSDDLAAIAAQHAITGEAQKFFVRSCTKQRGNLRGTTELLNEAYLASEGAPIGLAHLREAAKLLWGTN